MPSLTSWRSGRAGERGTIALEAVVIFPLVILLAWVGMQLVLIHLANRVALAAAAEGARAARVHTGSTAAGEQRARRYLADLGGSLLVGPAVHATRGPDSASVAVSGQAERIVPIIPLRVRQVVEGPVERFEGERAPR